MPDRLPYFLGCPVWACRDWIGSMLPEQTEPSELLRLYSRIFNTVEANSFFYALPPLATIERWMAESDSNFRFCPKFPKAISHEHRLEHTQQETKAFLKTLSTLAHGERLGTAFLQLAPSYNINGLDTLRNYLKALPREFEYAVEARHASWFDQGDNEKRLDDLLENLGMDKVIFDTRPLFSAPPADADEEDAQQRKPRSPVRKVALSKRPMLRLVGRNAVETCDPWIKEWAPIINKWILEGRRPHILVHAPNEAFAPYLARRLHQQLTRINPLIPHLPAFASDRATPQPAIQQLDLF